MRPTATRVWVFTCLLLAACSGAPQDNPPDYEVSGGDTKTPAPVPTTNAAEDDGPPSEPPAAAESTEEADPQADPAPAPPSPPPPTKPYAGMTKAAPKASFGGSPFCRYEMTIKDIAMDVGFLESGDLVAATVKDTAVEAAIQCPHAPMAPSNQLFTFKKATKTENNGWKIEFTGDAKNRPATALVAVLAPRLDGYETTLTWKRTDQEGPLAWTVRGKLPLAAK